jgi:hypothetical protein
MDGMGWPRHKVTVVWRPCAILPPCTQEHRQGDLCPTCKLKLNASTLALAPAPALLRWRPLVTAQSTSTTQRRRSHWRHHSVTGAGRGRGTALPRAPASAQRRSAGRRHGAGHWRIMTNTGALTLAPGPAHPRLPQLPWALLGTVSTSTGPWAPHHRTTAAATSQRPPAWWWVWWLLDAARAARRSTQPDARAPEHVPRRAGPLPPRRRQTATSLGSAPDRPVLPRHLLGTTVHDEQRPRRTATHDAARTPPPPPPPLGARLGQGMSRSKPHGGHGVGRRIGRDAPSDPRGWAPPAPPADDQPGGPLRGHLRHRCRTAHDPFPGPPKACVGLRGHELR